MRGRRMVKAAMEPGKRHRLRRTRLWLSGLFAVAIILMAVVFGLAQLAVPWVASHPEKISAMLSERLHRPVTIDRVDGHWDRNGPLLNLTGLHLGVASADPASANSQPLTIASAGIKINFFAWIRRNASWTEFRIAGVDIDLVHDAAGNWQVRGMDASRGDERNIDDNALFALGTLVLRDAHLTLDDEANGRRTRFSADEMRLINRGDLHRVLARVQLMETASSPLDVVIEYNSRTRAGRGYIGGQGIDIAATLRGYPIAGVLVHRGKGRMRTWVTFVDARLVQARFEADLSDVVLATKTSIAPDPSHDVLPQIGIDHLAFGARWQRSDTGWSVDVADLAIMRQGVDAPRGALHLRVNDSGGDTPPQYEVAVENIDLGATASVAMLVDTLPEGLRRWLYAGNPKGTLAVATARFVDRNDFDVAARFDGLAWHSYARLPSMYGFSGVVRGDQNAISVDLPRHNEVAVSVPHVFRQPLEFSELSGGIAVYRTDDAWRIETDALQFEGSTPGKEYGGELRGWVDIEDNGSRPTVDLEALVTHGEVQASHLFWPVNVMPPAAVNWLDHGLDAGHIVGGRAVFRGDLDDWPFRNNSGRFEAVAEIDDLRVRYLNDWPVAEHAHANIDFVDTSLHAEVSGGNVLNNRITSASADIPDLGDGPLDLTVSGQGSGKDLLGFVRATPLGTKFAGPLTGVDVGGQGKVDVKFFLPYKHIEDYTLDGTAQLTASDLSDSAYGLRFDAAAGTVKFNRSGFDAVELATKFRDKPAKFSLAVGGYVEDKQHVIEATLDTYLPVADVLTYAPALEHYGKYVSGDANWSARFSADSEPKEGSGQHLSLTSDLKGVAIDLPQPLAKHADSALPLKVVLTLPFIGADIDVHLGDLFNLRGHLPTPTAPFAANVTFGSEATATPPKGGMIIGGNAPAVDLSGWMDFSTQGPSGDGNMLDRVELHTPTLLAWERPLGEGSVRLGSTAEASEVAFTGVNIEGTLAIPREELRRRGITADFKKLYWPEAPETDAPSDDGATSPIEPSTIPPLHIRIGDFRLGKANYGTATVETVPAAEGMHFDQASTHSKSTDMRAHGDWVKRNGYQRSTFGIDLSTQSIGHMLESFGNPGLIDGGKTIAHIDASWAGIPSAFALGHINGGALKIDIGEGRIPDIDVGAGRLAGLTNLAALPRRLSFDFGDLFQKGYSFDSINGVFTMSDGYLYTEGLIVNSPTADMRIKGAMGLKTHDWDMVIEVTPHVSGTLLIGGALIGGPVGAAAGAVLGGILKNPINAATRSDYHVAGTWDKPSITKIGSTVVKKPAPPGSATPAQPHETPSATPTQQHEPAPAAPTQQHESSSAAQTQQQHESPLATPTQQHESPPPTPTQQHEPLPAAPAQQHESPPSTPQQQHESSPAVTVKAAQPSQQP